MGKREIWLGTELNRQRQPFRATEIVLAVTYKDLEGCETPVKTCKNKIRITGVNDRLGFSQELTPLELSRLWRLGFASVQLASIEGKRKPLYQRRPTGYSTRH